MAFTSIRRRTPSCFLAALCLVAMSAVAHAAGDDLEADAARLGALFAGVEAVKARDFDEAIERLEPLVDHESLLGDYVRRHLALALLEQKRLDEARLQLEALLAEHTGSLFTIEAHLKLAEIHREQGDCDRATPLYAIVRKRARRGSEGATATLRMAECLEAAGRHRQARRYYTEIRTTHPGLAIAGQAREHVRALDTAHPDLAPPPTTAARLAEAHLLTREGVLDEAHALALEIAEGGGAAEEMSESRLLMAEIAKRRGHSKARQRWLELVLEGAPRSREGRRAALALITDHWNRNEQGAALDAIAALLATAPPAATTRRAQLLQGRILAEVGDRRAAIDVMQKLARNGGDEESAALWHWCWLSYRELSARRAVQACDEARRSADDDFLRHRVTYWLVKALERDGDEARARPLREGLAETNPEGFYGMQARTEIAGEPFRLRPLGAGTSPDDSFAAALEAPGRKQSPGRMPNFLPSDATSQKHLQKAARLERAFLHRHAVRELDAVRLGPRRLGFEAQLWMARRMSDLGAHHLAMRAGLAASGLARSDDERLRADRWRYPIAFPRHVRRAALREQLDPFLVLALMRNESSFDPQALSPANARGLMQMIPSTGHRVAGQLGRTIDPDDLFDVTTNVTLGSHYLATLLGRYEGDVYRAVAAYNAGERAVERWWARNPGLEGPAWVEEIAYNETRNYVRRVIRDIQVYRDIYRAPRGLPKK